MIEGGGVKINKKADLCLGWQKTGKNILRGTGGVKKKYLNPCK